MKMYVLLGVVFISIFNVCYSQRGTGTTESKTAIALIDATVRFAIENKADFSNLEQMTAIASSKATAMGLVRDESYRTDFSSFSERFKAGLRILTESADFNSREEYVAAITEVILNTKKAPLELKEKSILIFHLALMIDVLNYGEQIYNSNPYVFYEPTQPPQEFEGLTPGFISKWTGTNRWNNEQALASMGWWSRWGRCLAAVLGGAITGGLTGGLGGSAIGTVTVPVVGTVALGVVGAVGGTIGGALTGAATSCVRWSPLKSKTI